MSWGGFDTLNASGFDAANHSTARSVIYFPLNSYVEHNSWTRVQLVQKVRWLEANLPILARTKSKIGQYTVGKGIIPRPMTSDEEWNKLAIEYFDKWAENPGLTSIDGAFDFYQHQRFVAESLVGDGESFTNLVNNPLTGHPQIQALDVFEIGSPSFLKGSEDFTDGVKLNRYGKPIAYAVQELQKPGSKDTKLREIGANSILHVFKRRRAKQVRGISWFHSSINQGIDALDIRALITATAKLHSSLAVTVSGKDTNNQNGAFSALNKSSATPNKNVENIFGGGLTSYLKEGEKLDLHSSDRPSENLLEFIKLLYHEIALSLGIPFETLWSLSDLGGASTRGALEDAQHLFDTIADLVIYQHSFPLYRWVLAWAMKHGKLRKCKDANWWATSWRTPAKITVDIGRSAQATIDLVKNGLMSHTEYFDSKGKEAKEEVLNQIQFVKWMQDECAKAGVNPNTIFSGIINEDISKTD